MARIIYLAFLVHIGIVNCMKIKYFDIQHTNTSTPGHVTLTCLVDVSKDTEKLNIELYRVYASYRTKLKKQIGGQRLIFTIHNITCDDLGVYECQGHQTGIQQRVWAQKLLEFHCPQKIKEQSPSNIILTEARTASIKIDVISNPLTTLTWFRTTNNSRMLEVVNDTHHVIYRQQHRFEPFKFTFILECRDINVSMTYVAVARQSDIQTFIYNVLYRGTQKEVTRTAVLITPESPEKCNPVLAIGWMTSAVLFLVLLFTCLVIAIIKRKGKSLRESLYSSQKDLYKR